MRFLRGLIGIIATTVYGFLKWNVQGYWYTIPLFIVVVCLVTED